MRGKIKERKRRGKEKKYCNFLYLCFIHSLSHGHTMIHTNTFVVDLNLHMQVLKSLQTNVTNVLSMSCMRCLYICLYAKFEILKTIHRLRGCTYPSLVSQFKSLTT
jgi:hypothetical protein